MYNTILLLSVVLVGLRADTPANCTYEQILGTWVFKIGPGGNNNTLDCESFPFLDDYTVSLYFPDIAFDQNGNKGFWTLIYNQGFEVVIDQRKYFAFSYFETSRDNDVISYCNQTFPGFSHNTKERDWACYLGFQSAKTYRPLDSISVTPQKTLSGSYKQLYKPNKDFIREINAAQTSWTATDYPAHSYMSINQLLLRAGGIKTTSFPKPAVISEETRKIVKSLPTEFDWRNFNHQNYVSPIRNQGGCGSCYAFASMAMEEARVRVFTNNKVQKVFSTQDVVSCSKYSQGCEGGFPYLVAGKYGQDFGIIEEDCFPYKGQDIPCVKTSCQRYYTAKYYYIGGYYGACNEALMKVDLVRNGPVAVSFEVYPDFKNYKGGIYHHTGLTDKFNPWEITNHVVLIVGYGQDNSTQEPYWIVKNSWGPDWGEQGFFRILRGTDECSIESIAVGTFPVV